MEEKKKRANDNHSSPTSHNKEPRKAPTVEELAACIAKQSRRKTAWTTFGLISCLSLGAIAFEIHKQRETISYQPASKPLVILSKENRADPHGIPMNAIAKSDYEDSYHVRTLMEENRILGDTIKNLKKEMETLTYQLEESHNEFLRSKVDPQNSKIVEMGRELRNKELANQNLQKQIKRLETDLDESQVRVKDMEINLDTMMAVVSDISKNQAYDDLKSELEAQRNVYHEEMGIYEKKISKLQDHAHTLEKKLAEARMEGDVLEQDLWHYTSLLNAKEDELAKAKKEWNEQERHLTDNIQTLVSAIDFEQTMTSQLEKRISDVIAHQEYTFDEHLALLAERDTLQNLCTELSASHYEIDVSRELLAKEQMQSLTLANQLERALRDYGEKANQVEVLAANLDAANQKIEFMSHYEGEIDAFKESQAKMMAHMEDLSNSLESEMLAKNKIRSQLEDVLANRNVDSTFFGDLQQQLSESAKRAEVAEKALVSRYKDVEKMLEAYSLGATDQEIHTLTAALEKTHQLESRMEHEMATNSEISSILKDRESEISELIAEAHVAQEEFQKQLLSMTEQLNEEKEANFKLQDQLNSQINQLTTLSQEKEENILNLKNQLNELARDSEQTSVDLLAERADLIEQLEELQGNYTLSVNKVDELSSVLSKVTNNRNMTYETLSRTEEELKNILAISESQVARIEELEEKLNYMGQKSSDAITSLRQREQDNEQLTAFINDFNTLYAQKDADLKQALEIQTVLDKTMQSLTESEMSNLELLVERASMFEQLDEMRIAHNKTMNQLDEMAGFVAEVTSNKINAEHQLESNKEELMALVALSERQSLHIRELEGKLDQMNDLTTILKDKEEENAEMAAFIDHLESLYSEKEAELKDALTVYAALENTTKRLSESELSSLELYEERTSLIEQLQELHVAHKQTVQQLDEMTKLTASLTEEKDIAEWKFRSTSEKVDELIGLRGEQGHRINELEEKLNHMGQKAADALASLHEKESVNHKLNQNIGDLKTLISIKESDIDRFIAENSNLQNEISNLNSVHNSLLAKVGTFKHRIEEAQKEAGESKHALAIAESDFETMKQSYRNAKADLLNQVAILTGNLEQEQEYRQFLAQRLDDTNVCREDERNWLKDLETKYQLNEENLRIAQADLQVKSEELSLVRDKLAFTLAKAEHLEDQLHFVTDQTEQVNEYIQSLEQEIAKANQTLFENQDALLASNMDFEMIEDRYEEITKNLTSKNESLIAELNEAKSKSDRLIAKVQSLAAEKNDNFLKIDELHEAITHLQSKSEHREFELMGQLSEVEKMYKELVDTQQKESLYYNDKLNETLTRLHQSQGEIEDLERKLSYAEEELNTTKNTLATAYDTIKEVENLNATLSYEASSHEEMLLSQLKARNDEVEALKTSLAEQYTISERETYHANELSEKIKAMEQLNLASESMLVDEQKQLVDALARQSELQEYTERLKSELFASLNQLDSVKGLLSTTEAQNEMISRNLEKKENQLEVLMAEVDAMKSNLQSSESALENLHARYKKVNAELASKNEELSSKLDQHETLAASLGMKITDLAVAQEMEANEKNRAYELMQEKQVEIDQLQAQINELYQQQNQYIKQVAEAEIKLRETQEEAERAKKAMQQELSELQEFISHKM